MKFYPVILPVLAINLLLSFGCKPKETVEKFEPNVHHQKIREIIAPFVTTNNFSGTVALSNHDSIVYLESFGKMSHEFNLKNHQDSKFYLASVSMLFTSAAIMKLVEQGKITLSDTLDKYLPSYKNATKITIHDLMAERSGIPAIGKNSDVDYDIITQFTQTPESLYTMFQEQDLLYEPGSQYSHERSGYIVLALIIEKLSGKSFGDFLREEIFDPLEMHGTGHSEGEHMIVENLAKGYSTKDLYGIEASSQIDWSSKTGHASIFSTSADLIKFGNAALNHQLLSQESWDKIFTDHGDRVGYGLFVTDHLGRNRVHMNGRSPGFSSFFCIYPEERVVMAITSNLYGTVPTTMGNMILSEYFNEPYEPLRLSSKNPSQQEIAKFLGTYKFNANFYRPNFELEVFDKDDQLYTSWGGLLPVEDENGEITRYILRTYWSDIQFEEKNGVVEAMIYDDFRGEKLKD